MTTFDLVRRLKWFMFVPAFLFTYWAALMLYWLPDRQAWVHQHPSLGGGYGDGIVIARAVIASTGPALAALSALLLRPPRSLILLLLGVIAGVCGFLLQRGLWDRVFHAFGFRVAVHLPVTVAAVVVIASYIAVDSFHRVRAAARTV
ncbi:MAG: hypothetical protein ACR2HH_16860 [Chthoniobacterales bacterium]